MKPYEKPKREERRSKRMNRMSVRMRDRIERRKTPHAAQLREYPYCEPARAGCPHRCDGVLTVHEPWTKARGGPQDDRRNMVTACIEHNRLMSQAADCMEWAHANGFLVRTHHGAAWLAAGGVRRKDAA